VKRLVVLISGEGTNLQAILDARVAIGADVAAVISNRLEARGLQRARLAGVPAIALPATPSGSRADYDAALAERAMSFAPDWIVLAGWMRVLSMRFLGQFPGRVVNLHPASPGAFPGTRAIERAFDAFTRGEIDRTGVMVHLVPDEGVDTGPVLAHEEVPILASDRLEALQARVHEVEHRLLVGTLAHLSRAS
jgi:phosphoribosylglycinamide formyltransferase-1